MKKVLRLYDGMSNQELYELAQICIEKCQTDLRAVERRAIEMLDDIEQLNAERNVLKMPVRR